MNKKIYEIILVFVILGVVLIFSFGYINNILDKTLKTSAETQTRTLMITAEQIQFEYMLKGENELPLVLIFVDNKMYLKKGKNAKNIFYDGNIKFTGKMPDAGEIVILYNNKIIVNNLKINNFVCNTYKDNEVKCKKT